MAVLSRASRKVTSVGKSTHKPMRKKFVEGIKFSEAFDECTWANEVVRVTDGFMCFESEADYEIWNKQK